MISLRDKVDIRHNGRIKSGTVIGRTFEGDPHYDVLLDNDKEIPNVPLADVRIPNQDWGGPSVRKNHITTTTQSAGRK